MKAIGFLGLGEVGHRFSKGLRASGLDIKGYDKLWNVEPFGGRIQQNCKESGVELVGSSAALAQKADWIFAATTPKAALETAQSVAPYLKAGQIYIDLNSAPPEIKAKIGEIVKPAAFIDGAILGSPSLFAHKAPVVLSGPMADKMAAALCGAGMNVRCIGQAPGQASALKVIRSVFTKGLECILLECLHAARTFSIDAEIKKSIVEFLKEQPIDSTINMLITTNAIHAKRRAQEMEGVVGLLKEARIDGTMSAAAVHKLYWSDSLGLRDAFGGEIPDRMEDVLNKLV